LNRIANIDQKMTTITSQFGGIDASLISRKRELERRVDQNRNLINILQSSYLEFEQYERWFLPISHYYYNI